MKTLLLEFIENALCDVSEIHVKMKTQDLLEQEIMLIRKMAGKDCTRFVRMMDKVAVRHVFKNHGDEVRERLRGQLPIVIEDFLLVEIILVE